MGAPAPAAPVYTLKCNKSQLLALVTDYCAALDWVPALPSVRDKYLQFKHSKGSFWFDWFASPGVRYIFFLCGVGGAALLSVQHYDFHVPLHREVIRIPFDDLSRRGVLA